MSLSHINSVHEVISVHSSLVSSCSIELSFQPEGEILLGSRNYVVYRQIFTVEIDCDASVWSMLQAHSIWGFVSDTSSYAKISWFLGQFCSTLDGLSCSAIDALYSESL